MKTRNLKVTAVGLLLAMVAGCVPIPNKEYGGTWHRDFKSAKSKADLVVLAGEPDARSVDGRFYIYGHDTETEWYMTLFGYPMDVPITTTRNQVRMLHEFDADNRILDYKIYKCQDVESSICNDDPQISLWAAIQDVRGQQKAEEYRQSDAIAAVRIQLWHDAAKSGDVEVLEQLLEQGVTVRAEFEGTTALYTAAREGHTDAVVLLLEHGAAVNITDSRSGNPPINAAAGRGHTSVVRSLLQGGADANARNLRNFTPLFLATRKGHADVVRLLIEAGAKVNHRAESGGNILMAAIGSGNPEIVKYLLDQGTKVNDMGWFFGNDTAMTVAANTGNLDIARLLIERGANVNRGTSWSAPIHSAIANGDYEMTRLLLENGANPNNKIRIHADTWTGWRRDAPLDVAGAMGREDLVALIKEHGGR
jgi:ankyrin repeat protein